MGTRVLRQHYEGVATDVDPELGAPVESWLRHRRRFMAALRSLDDGQWQAMTRCTEWNAKDVVAHLVSADAFWTVSLNAARAGAPPTTYLEGFDPSTSLEPLVAGTRTTPMSDMLDQFAASTDTLAATAETFGADDWTALGESPFGHLESRFLFAHAFWDSWLHERDVCVPLGLAPTPEQDELFAATWFTFFVGGVQGGLLSDPAPVGVGLDVPVAAQLRFDDLPDRALDIRVDEGVHIRPTDPAGATPVGPALDLVEGFAGRATPDFDAVKDPDLAAHLARAAQIL